MKAAHQPSQAAETLSLLLGALTSQDLADYVKALNKTRKRRVVFGINGHIYEAPRAQVRDLVAAHMKDRAQLQ